MRYDAEYRVEVWKVPTQSVGTRNQEGGGRTTQQQSIVENLLHLFAQFS